LAFSIRDMHGSEEHLASAVIEASPLNAGVKQFMVLRGLALEWVFDSPLCRDGGSARNTNGAAIAILEGGRPNMQRAQVPAQ
jgi:hypothetical protein